MTTEGRDSTSALMAVVGALVGLICVCAVAAISLAVAQFKEHAAANKERASTSCAERRQVDPTHVAVVSPLLSHAASATNLKGKRGGWAAATVTGSVNAALGSNGGNSKLRHRPNSSCSNIASVADQAESGPNSCALDTQDTMNSAMVQEILGSVDANHVRETQVLLQSFNWDLNELLHLEGCSRGEVKGPA